jgi:menaquinone-specific isochorismate synthase
MRDLAFIETSPGRLFVGWGPFEQLPFRRPDRPAFFITDFFLDDPHPWRHPASWEDLTLEEFASRFRDEPSLAVEWQPPLISEFAPLFSSAIDAMGRGDFKKIVPVIFEHGRFTQRSERWRYLLSQLMRGPATMRAYGYAYQSHGMIGATPEVLFESAEEGYRTMALAGTRPRDHASELLHDPKELREHRMVVDDIVRRLAPFGNIEIGTLSIVKLTSIAHLATPIRFEENGSERMSFTEMVRRLHPTAALGCSPRTESGERWLREADRGVKRRTFGAPFGLERDNRRALALVAIRNLQWSGEKVRIGSGAGLLPESRIEREFDELRQKREQVKALFGIDAPVETAHA